MSHTIAQISANRNKKINKVESVKSIQSIEEAYAKIDEYAKAGYEAIADADKNVFLKYFGIFDKEKPNGPNHFMMRVRIPGGQMTAAQAMRVGEIAKTYGNNYIDITTRMQVELRYLKIEDIPSVIEGLNEVGITTYQTGIDNLRNIVTDPLDGLGADNVIASMPLIAQMQEVFLKKSEWIGTLPRKFNTAITGSFANRCNIFSHDCSFALAQKEGVYGYNVYLGGRVGVLAKPSNVFVRENEVVPFFAALIEIFKEYGFRDNRNKNRLHFFIQEVGMQALVEEIKNRSALSFDSFGDTVVNLDHFDAKQGRVKLNDGTYALHVVIPAGIFDGEAMREAGEIAKHYGGQIRLSIDQNLYITGIKEEDVENVLSWDLFEKYKNVNSVFFNHMISCAGSDTCSFGVIRGKVDAIELSAYLSEKIALDDAMIRIYWSACVKGCGIHELGDIGFLGCKAKVADVSVPGVDIMLGGSLLDESKEAKTVLKSIPISIAKHFLEMLVLEYKRLKKPSESFEKFNERVLGKYSRGALAFLMSFNYYTTYVKEKPELVLQLDTDPKTAGYEAFEVFHFGEKLYYALEGKAPYGIVNHFNPEGKSVKIEADIDKEIKSIIEKMISSEERAEVFSELLVELNQF